jgi:6-phosphogluconolactonase
MGKRLRHVHGYLTVGRLLALACVAVLAVVGAANAAADKPSHHEPVGAVYTESNNPAGNAVTVFDRYADGTLALRQTVSTGGNGSTQGVGCGPGCPILDSQNEVVVSDDGKNVIAVNAGSDTVSSFRETEHHGLRLVGQVSSGGDMPESLALHDHTLYVLNVATENLNGTTGNVYGLRVSDHGHLSPLGSSQPLAHAAPPDHSADPRALGFDHDGKVLVATEIAAGFNDPTYGPPGAIDTFVIGHQDKAGPAVSHHTSDALPFGFAIDDHDQLVLSQIHKGDPPFTNGTVSTYQLSNSGGVTPIDTKPSGGILPCWVIVTGDNKVAYVVNTGAGNPAPVNGFGIGNHGALTPLSPAADSTAGEFARTDEALSKDSKYLYVLAPQVGPGAPSHIDEYSVNKNGSLTLIGATPAGANLGIGASGVAAR